MPRILVRLPKVDRNAVRCRKSKICGLAIPVLWSFTPIGPASSRQLSYRRLFGSRRTFNGIALARQRTAVSTAKNAQPFRCFPSQVLVHQFIGPLQSDIVAGHFFGVADKQPAVGDDGVVPGLALDGLEPAENLVLIGIGGNQHDLATLT